MKVGSHVGMFGEVRCDITTAIHRGRNTIGVHVLGRLATEESNQVMGVAVTGIDAPLASPRHVPR